MDNKRMRCGTLRFSLFCQIAAYGRIMKLPEQWAPLKLNLLLGIVALQFTFASIAFIVRFKHHPPSRYQMAETNVRAGPSPPLPLSLLSSFSTGSLGEGLSSDKWVSFASVCTGQPRQRKWGVCLKIYTELPNRGCSNRHSGCKRIKRVTGHAVLQILFSTRCNAVAKGVHLMHA